MVVSRVPPGHHLSLCHQRLKWYRRRKMHFWINSLPSRQRIPETWAHQRAKCYSGVGALFHRRSFTVHQCARQLRECACNDPSQIISNLNSWGCWGGSVSVTVLFGWDGVVWFRKVVNFKFWNLMKVTCVRSLVRSETLRFITWPLLRFIFSSDLILNSEYSGTPLRTTCQSFRCDVGLPILTPSLPYSGFSSSTVVLVAWMIQPS